MGPQGGRRMTDDGTGRRPADYARSKAFEISAVCGYGLGGKITYEHMNEGVQFPLGRSSLATRIMPPQGQTHGCIHMLVSVSRPGSGPDAQDRILGVIVAGLRRRLAMRTLH